MINLQNKVLRYLYKKPRTLREICQKVLKLSEKEFHEMYHEIIDEKLTEYTIFDENTNWIESNLSLSKRGVEFIQTQRQQFIWRWIPYSITTIIAIIALINSILARLGK